MSGSAGTDARCSPRRTGGLTSRQPSQGHIHTSGSAGHGHTNTHTHLIRASSAGPNTARPPKWAYGQREGRRRVQSQERPHGWHTAGRHGWPRFGGAVLSVWEASFASRSAATEADHRRSRRGCREAGGYWCRRRSAPGPALGKAGRSAPGRLDGHAWVERRIDGPGADGYRRLLRRP
jgi:hypothetical protein